LGTYAVRISYGGVSLTINYEVVGTVLDTETQSVLALVSGFNIETGSIAEIGDVEAAYNALDNDAKTYVLENSNIRDFLEFYDGSGSENDPFQIANWYHLNNVRNELSDKFFEMNADLDSDTFGYELFASSTANDNKGWDPLVDGLESSTSFKGTFNGSNFMISDLFINRPTEEYVGLFSGLESSTSLVKDFTLENIEITGYRYVGGLAGIVKNGANISNVQIINGNITGERQETTYTSSGVTIDTFDGGDGVGGLAGKANDVVINSVSATGTVTGTTTRPRSQVDTIGTGGLFGLTENVEINNSHFSGDVIGYKSVGGLIGQAIDTTLIECFATGEIRLSDDMLATNESTTQAPISDRLGGLIGEASNVEVYRSFADSELTELTWVKTTPTVLGDLIDEDNGSEDVGGLIGYSQENLLIEDSYFRGIMHARHHVGGLVGRMTPNTDNAHTKHINRTYTDVIVLSTNSEGTIGKIVGMIADSSTNYDFSNNYYDGVEADKGINFTSSDDPSHPIANDSFDDWDSTVWAVDETINDGYPYLTSNPPQ
jgi:hypothetical protein